VNSVIRALNARSVKQEERLADFRAYIENSTLGTQLKEKAIKSYVYYVDKKADMEFASSLNGIPRNLLSNMIGSVYARTIKRIKFFESLVTNRDREFIVDLIIRAKPFEASRLELISGAGDFAEEMVFILRGSVRIYSTRSVDYVNPFTNEASTKVEQVTEGFATQGDFFGDFEYVTRTTRDANYEARCKCDLLAISYANLDFLLAKYTSAGDKLMSKINNRLRVFQHTIGVERMDTTRATMVRGHVFVNGDRKACDEVLDHALGLSEYESTYQVISLITRISSNAEVDGVEVIEPENIDSINFTEETKMELYSRLLIHPDSTEKVLWDLLLMSLIFYVAFVITTQVLFIR
jgi:CRP-like cAMP-binding protein